MADGIAQTRGQRTIATTLEMSRRVIMALLTRSRTEELAGSSPKYFDAQNRKGTSKHTN